MIAESGSFHWSRARAASHSLSQSLNIDLDPEDDGSIAGELNELILFKSVGRGYGSAAHFETSLFGADVPNSGQGESANLVIWPLQIPHHAGREFPELRPKTAAFHELDALRSDDRLALQAIRDLRTTLLPYRERLAARLETLLRAYQEEYEGRSLSPTAIGVFVKFLSAHAYLRRPRLSATPSGDLYAEWAAQVHTLFGVRFMPSGEVQYVVFTPNALHRGRVDRTSGSTTADALMEKVGHLCDLRWLTDEG